MYSKKLIFWASCLGMLLFGIVLITLGSITPDLKIKLDLSEIESGTLFSIMPVGILLGSLFFGPLVDNYGYRILLVTSCFLMFAGFEGVAYLQSKELLKVCIFFIGLGGGAVNGATNALVSDISSNRDKGANLSLLGVFFGIGALGMPLVLGLLKTSLPFEPIIAAVGILSFFTAIIYLTIKFPPPKQTQGFPLAQGLTLIKDRLLLLIAFFLFFQSSLEGITNNWTTSYLIDHLSVPQSNALFGLSLLVAGMVIMRLLLASIFRSFSTVKIMVTSFILILLSLLLIKTAISFYIVLAGLLLLGGGLAAGFPIMLGIVGSRFSNLSGTAFSFVLVIGLLGNTLVNYGMGIIAQNFGVKYLPSVASGEMALMVIIFYLIMRQINKSSKQSVN